MSRRVLTDTVNETRDLHIKTHRRVDHGFSPGRASGHCRLHGLTFGSVKASTAGYVAMTLGVVLSLIVGVGLMALLFYSSRGGYDEPPRLISDARTDRSDE
jgi:hypothetical protein